MSALSIKPFQIKIIYTLGNELGIVDRTADIDLLHEMIHSMTNKEHVSNLTSDEAMDVIKRLRKDMKGPSRLKHKATHIKGMASEGEIKKIWALIYELKKYDKPGGSNISAPKRLQGFLKKYAEIDDLRFLTHDKANGVIEGLKGLIRNERKKLN